MEGATDTKPRHRPYFVPDNIDFNILPEHVKVAFSALVEPCYIELVLGASTALERSAGATLTFLLSLEILDQLELGQNMNLAQTPIPAAPTERDKLMQRHLRLIGAKQQTANFIMRLQSLRSRPMPINMGPPAL